MGVDTGITGSTRNALVLMVEIVEVSLGVTVFLGETKIHHIDLVATFADAQQEVVGLDITVNNLLRVDVLNAGDELIGKEQDSLEREPATAKDEHVLQTGTQEVDHHYSPNH